MKRAIGVLLAVLLLAAPAHALDGAGWDTGSWNSPTITGPITVIETLGPDAIADSTFATACGAGNWTCSGAWATADGTATRTANASNLALVSTTAVDESATGTWYRWDVSTNLTAGTLTPSFCGQTLTAISTTGPLITTYRLWCPYTAAALAVPTLTAVAATAGTVTDAPLYPITSVQSGTGLAFKAGAAGMHFGLGGTFADFWQGSDAQGIYIHGYDDMKGVGMKFGVSAAGSNTITAVGGLLAIIGGTDTAISFTPVGTGDLSFITDADSIAQFGDGTYSWGHAPAVGIEGVTEIDSKLWLDSDLSVAGVANFASRATLSGTAPGLTSCGNSPTITAGSNDHGGVFVIGATGTGCTLTFVADQGTDTACVVGGAAAATWASTDTALVVTAAPGEYSYICYGL